MGLFDFAALDIPAGWWFHLRNEDIRFDLDHPNGTHPWLVLTDCMRRTAFLHVCVKSTKQPRKGQTALWVEKHSDGCRLDENGWIKVDETRRPEKSTVLGRAVFICEESDISVLSQVHALTSETVR